MRVIAPPEIKLPDDILFLGRAFRARRELRLDLSGTRWISPLGVVAVLSVALAAQQRGLRVAVVAPGDRIARTYLDRIGFYEELRNQGWAVAGDMDLDPTYAVRACLPVAPLRSEREIEAASDKLADALREVPVAPGLYDQVLTVAIELTQNAREHGSACYMVVQTHTGRSSGTPGVHVAVADFGAGFATTLRPVLGRLSDEEAILRAFDERVSGTGLPERGFGLGYVRDEIDAYRSAVLSIVSRKARVTRTGSTFRVQPDTIDFRGTVATAYFPYTPPGAATEQ